MQIIVTGRHFEVTEFIHKKIVEKIEALFQYYPTLKVTSVRVTMEIEKNHQVKVDICAAVKKQMMVAGGATLELYTAVDEAVDKLRAQVERYVDKYKRPEQTPPARELCVPEVAEA